eukprot:80795-Amphidinium_carterae.1
MYLVAVADDDDDGVVVDAVDQTDRLQWGSRNSHFTSLWRGTGRCARRHGQAGVQWGTGCPGRDCNYAQCTLGRNSLEASPYHVCTEASSECMRRGTNFEACAFKVYASAWQDD